MARIVLLGAGSMVFTKNLLSDLLSYPELAESTLVLHDIDGLRLSDARLLAERMVAGAGSGILIESHLDQDPALDGADYVINEIMVGGMASAETDFQIAAGYGVRQTIADTLGIGGVFRALRTIPVMVALGDNMARRCPDSLLLNYTNPMSMVPWGVYAGSPFQRVVGICHSVRDTQALLADLVGVPAAEVDFLTAGVNHQAFVLRFERAGENLYPLLDKVIDADPDGLGRRVRVAMYRALGYFPTESSEHGAEYVPWFMRHDGEIERYRIEVSGYLRRLAAHRDEYYEVTRQLADGEPVRPEPTNELAPLIIRSIETGTPAIVHGNVRNGSKITNLPADACVEVPCQVDGSGVHPMTIGDLPPQLAALNRNFLNVSELTVRAVLEGRRDYVYHAAMLDPNTAATLPLSRIRQMVDDYFAVYRDSLPPGLRR
ncbi:alpha-galactosidase [Actinocrispum wychmicini]|uniref:Alpha-galactosidase n=1 Tax=Actinocrispum wychmicini TaxID=1213861 RepID=A0A4R2JJI0_9PSEU|nr:alpha-galactosidase [Actinocrispum wychmicini]TCO54325.1 alpha-galactosidase [Actinocrispum wychmicini]